MKTQLIALTFFLSLLTGCETKKKKTTVIYSSDVEAMVIIRAPIDGAENILYPTDTIYLQPNLAISMEFDIDEFGYIRSRYPNDRVRTIQVIEGEKYMLDYKNGDTKSGGANAKGNEYFRANGRRMMPMYEIDSLLRSRLTDNTLNYEGINQDIEKEFIIPHSNNLQAMVEEGEISQKFADILYKEIRYCVTAVSCIKYWNTGLGRLRPFAPTDADRAELVKLMDELYDNPEMTNKDKIKYGFNSIPYGEKFGLLSQAQKDSVTAGYDLKTFGNNAKFLLAPKYMHPMLLGRSFISDLQYNNKSFDHDKMYQYLSENFPDSEYLPIIDNMRAKIEAEKAKSKEKIKFLDSDKINSFADLVNQEELKGKYLYIDLWATWCMPCLAEFKHKPSLDKLLSKYGNIAQVYISTDEEKEGIDKAWRDQVDYHRLEGYNIMASEKFSEFLSNELYGGSKMMRIPRYVLVGKDGKVLDNELPRPATIEKLEEELDKILK